MKKKLIWMTVILVIIAGSVLGVTLVRKGKNSAVKYRKEAVGRGDIQALVVTSGTLNTIDLVDVGSQVSGKVTALYADYNSLVKKGQVVAEIELQPLQMKIQQNEANYRSRVAALEQAKVNLTNLKNKYDRAMSLFDKKLVSIEDKEAAEASYLSAKADVTAAEANLAQAKITLDLSKVDLSHAIIQAPVDGIVITRKVSAGQTLQAGMTVPVLFQIATDLTKMKVECNVDEADIGRVKEGQKAQFTVEAFPNDTFNGVVQQVRYAATTTSNVVTYSVVINVDNPEKKLRPGMTATVSVIANEAKNVLRVANAALRFTPDMTQDELAKYMKEAGERMMAQRQQQGASAGQPGQAAPAVAGGPADPTQGQVRTGEGQRPQGQGFAGGMRSGAGQRRQQISRVWVQDKDGKLRVVFIRPGITDNTYTEILRSDLKEGDEVIIGKSGTSAATTTTGQNRGPGGPPMMFMR
ncbi:MAG TPA: efflux RND transporter periplasmic adaptor subunit [Terriglobales bacterium]|nr:efflux RND transporter periplasmic adaptor subunit [Terriglobales bacterium]